MTEVAFICPEHGDEAVYSHEDHEASCVSRDEVLDLDSPEVRAAIDAAWYETFKGEWPDRASDT